MPIDFNELKTEVDSQGKILRVIEKDLEKLKHTIYGLDDEGGGLRGQIKELEEILEEIKKYLPNLQSLEEVKKNSIRIFWVILLSGLMALFNRYVSVEIGKKNIQALEEVKAAVEQKAENY